MTVLTKQQKLIIANKHRADKIKLESSLIAALLRLFRVIAKDLVNTYKKGRLLSTNAYQDNFEKLLLKQYGRVNQKINSKYIDSDINDKKQVDKQSFDDFKNLILAFLLPRLALILFTTQKDVDRVVNKQKSAENPNNTSQLQLAFLSATLYRARLIGITETQNAFELKKHTIAANVLKMNGYKLKKSWVTILDGRERLWHAEAFGQTVFINNLFNVKDEMLMYPGDISHGASPSNICNCRCSAIYENGIFIRQTNT